MTFREKAEAFQEDAPARAAARANETRARRARGKATGLLALILLAVVGLIVIVLLIALIVAAVSTPKLWYAVGAIVVVVAAGMAWSVTTRG